MYYSKDNYWTTEEVEASREARKSISRILLKEKKKKKKNALKRLLKKLFK